MLVGTMLVGRLGVIHLARTDQRVRALEPCLPQSKSEAGRRVAAKKEMMNNDSNTSTTSNSNSNGNSNGNRSTNTNTSTNTNILYCNMIYAGAAARPVQVQLDLVLALVLCPNWRINISQAVVGVPS